MKKTIVSLLVVAALVGIALGCTPHKDGYVIKGVLSEMPDSTLVYLRLVGPPNRDIDSTYVIGGRFGFEGVHDGEAEWTLISVKGRFVPLCDFYLENGVIEIKGDEMKAKATGTEINAQHRLYKDSINSMFGEISRVYSCMVLGRENREEADSLKAVLNSMEAEVLEREKAFVKRYPDSPVSLGIVEYICRSAKSDDILEYVSYLSERQQGKESVKSLAEYAERKRKTEEGAEAPLFTLKDDRGNTVNLSDYRGKYLLVDFWASWCGPCRASFSLVAGLYKKYAGDKFDILGVSLDQNEEAWRNALKEEKCAWTQVVDLDGSVAREYAVSTIPMMLLVAPDGTVCGRYDKGTVGDKLSELFD